MILHPKGPSVNLHRARRTQWMIFGVRKEKVLKNVLLVVEVNPVCLIIQEIGLKVLK